jgi:hypothetical protein
LKNLGFSPLRRELPAVPREIDDEIEKETIVVPPSNQQGSLNTVVEEPPTRTATVTAPSFVPQNVSPALQAPAQPSGTVDRTRYAAMFPNDPASALIRQGIGSMMG